MNQDQSRIVAELNENGFAQSHVKDLFDPQTLEYFNKGIEYYNGFMSNPHIQERANRIAQGNPIQDRGKWFEITAYEYLNRGLSLRDGGFVNMYLSPNITDIAEAYHGVTPRLRNVLTWIHPQNPTQSERASQVWHRDQEDYKILKVFIAYSDIGPDNGPTQFVKKTQYEGKYGDITNNMNGKSTSTFKYDIPQEEIVSCEGPAGSIFFVNVNGLHKGGLIKKGVRCLTHGNYLNPLAPHIVNNVLGTFDYSDKVNILDRNSDEYLALTDKQRNILK